MIETFVVQCNEEDENSYKHFGAFSDAQNYMTAELRAGRTDKAFVHSVAVADARAAIQMVECGKSRIISASTDMFTSEEKHAAMVRENTIARKNAEINYWETLVSQPKQTFLLVKKKV